MANKHCHVVDGKNIKFVELFFGLFWNEALVGGHNMHFPKYLEEKIVCFFSFYIKCIIVVQALYYLFLFNVKSGHTEPNLFSIAPIVIKHNWLTDKNLNNIVFFQHQSVKVFCYFVASNPAVIALCEWKCGSVIFIDSHSFLGFFYFCFCLFYFL